MKKSVIYETRGRAREFNELAINLFSGCGHRCIYCYGATVTHQSREDFENQCRPRVTEEEIRQSAKEFAQKGEHRRVLLCFVTDPYQPIEDVTQLTRKAIIALHDNGFGVHILTKGGLRSVRDFDLLSANDAYATTLTLISDTESLKWEPFAAPPSERIIALKKAYQQGIETWVSFEPVIDINDTFRLLEMTRGFVGHYKVGTMNYHPHAEKINWEQYGWKMKRMMDTWGVKYYFKKDLLRAMKILPANFQQTWTCR